MSAAGKTTALQQAWGERRAERHLLVWCLLCITLGFILVLGSMQDSGRAPVWADLLPLGGYALALVCVHLTLVAAQFRGDQILVAAVAFLAGFGLLAQYRLGTNADTGAGIRALLLFPAGMLVLLAAVGACMGGRYRVLAAKPWVWGGLSLALVAILLATGQRFRGGVYAMGFTTPTEVLKLSVVLFLTGFIARYAQPLGRWEQSFHIPLPPWVPRWERSFHLPLPPWVPLWRLAAFWIVLTGLLVVQRDLGMVVILSVALLTLLVVGTRRVGYLVYGLLAVAGIGALAVTAFEHGLRRVEVWADPFADPTGDGWQILQGLSGMYSGGLWGEGFGQGMPGYTPIADSDFIYSVVGEELGFVGCVIVVLFFLIVFARGTHIARHSRDPIGTLLATGLTAVLAAQTFLNIGGVTKFVPLTGITLPFISHGGTSLLTAFAALGLLLAVSDTCSTSPRQAERAPAAPRPRARKPSPAPSRPRQPAEVRGEDAPAPKRKPKPAPTRQRAPRRAPSQQDPNTE